jgi:hypothetical protein
MQRRINKRRTLFFGVVGTVSTCIPTCLLRQSLPATQKYDYEEEVAIMSALTAGLEPVLTTRKCRFLFFFLFYAPQPRSDIQKIRSLSPCQGYLRFHAATTAWNLKFIQPGRTYTSPVFNYPGNFERIFGCSIFVRNTLLGKSECFDASNSYADPLDFSTATTTPTPSPSFLNGLDHSNHIGHKAPYITVLSGNMQLSIEYWKKYHFINT